jgi:hypothetical protein
MQAIGATAVYVVHPMTMGGLKNIEEDRYVRQSIKQSACNDLLYRLQPRLGKLGIIASKKPKRRVQEKPQEDLE